LKFLFFSRKDANSSFFLTQRREGAKDAKEEKKEKVRKKKERS